MILPARISHRTVYLFGLTLLAIGLPVSVFLMSVSQFILVFNWILERRFAEKWNVLKTRPALLVFISIFILHVLGLLWTSWPEGFTGAGYNGLKDLRLKLPMLLLPLVVGTSRPLEFKELKAILYFFSGSVLVGTLISFVVYLGWTNHPVNSSRDLSLFISHIRFALLINVSIFCLLHLLFRKTDRLCPLEKYLILTLVVWFMFFFIILQSFTGIVIFGLTLLVIALFSIRFLKKKTLQLSLVAIVVFGLAWLGFSGYQTYREFSKIRQVDYRAPESYTRNGNPYFHNFSDKRLENGWFVGQYLCEEELTRAWNRLGKIPFDGVDGNGQQLKFTLVRYMTSLGLRKDSLGVSKLDSLDIQLICEGKASSVYRKRFSMIPRLYEVYWEIDDYLQGGNPSGHSVTQRIEFTRAAFAIIRENPWFGVGTGDVKPAFDHMYVRLNSALSPDYRHRAHNQFLTFFIAFGAIGFILIMGGMVFPIIREKGNREPLFLIFLLIALVSMVSEDTLETQPGVTFFTFFYVLFLFGGKDGPASMKQGNDAGLT